MKRELRMVIALLILVGIIAFASQAPAGSVADRATFAGPTNKIGYWTNSYQVSGIELKRLSVMESTFLTNSVTFSRITADGLYTQTIGVVGTTIASATNKYGQGSAIVTNWYLQYGDIVRATGSDGGVAISNTFTGMLEFEVQQH